MEREKAYRRYVRNKAIKRKKRIRNKICGDGNTYYKFDGQYSKGKIHCSCPLCTYDKYYDLKRLEDFKQEKIFKSQLEEMGSQPNGRVYSNP